MKKIFLAIFLFFFFFTNHAFAQTQTPEPLNLTVNPHFFDITVNPGDSVTKTIRVRNNNDTPTTLTVSVQKLTPDVNGQIILKNFTQSDSYANWLTIGQATISANPKEWTDVPFTITVPKTAAFGYYWAILISTGPGKSQSGPTTHITGAVAIPVLLAVAREGVVFDARLLNFQTNSGWYEYVPAIFLTTIENKSNVHIKPIGTIFINDWLGNRVAQIPINKDAGSILPNAKRVFETPWNDSFITYDPKTEDGRILTDSKGKTQMQVNIHFEKLLSLRMGKYTATAIVVVSGDKHDISFEQTTTFFVFPWKILTGLTLFVLLAGVGLWNTMKNIWHHGKKLFTK